MRKKQFIFILALALLLIAGCTRTETHNTTLDDSDTSVVNATPDTSSNNGYEKKETPSQSSLAPSLPLKLHIEKIQGDIKNIYYADENQVLLLADKLYLYNLDTESVSAEAAPEAFDQERFQVIKDGYVAVGVKISTGNSSGGWLATDGGIAYSAIFYDRELNKELEFPFNTLLKKDETILSSKAIAFTADGTQAAYATSYGLFLYNFKTKQKTTVVDLKNEDAETRSGVEVFEQIGFTNGDKTLAFKAQSSDIPAVSGKPTFDTGGTVSLDGSGLSNRTFDGYTCKELTTYNQLLFFAEDFTTPSGRVLVMEVPGGATKLHTLTEKGESGFISGSDAGHYFATTLADRTGWKVRVYDTDTGKLQAEQHIPSDGEARYMANDPIVKIIDDKRIYIVLVGAKQADIKTKIVAGRF